jgi:hypothetical protein
MGALTLMQTLVKCHPKKYFKAEYIEPLCTDLGHVACGK